MAVAADWKSGDIGYLRIVVVAVAAAVALAVAVAIVAAGLNSPKFLKLE